MVREMALTMQRHLAFIRAYSKNMGNVDFADRIIKYYNTLAGGIVNHLPPAGVVHPQCIRDRVVLQRASWWHEQSPAQIMPDIPNGMEQR